jgi:hypothetical protein
MMGARTTVRVIAVSAWFFKQIPALAIIQERFAKWLGRERRVLFC